MKELGGKNNNILWDFFISIISKIGTFSIITITVCIQQICDYVTRFQRKPIFLFLSLDLNLSFFIIIICHFRHFAQCFPFSASASYSYLANILYQKVNIVRLNYYLFSLGRHTQIYSYMR